MVFPDVVALPENYLSNLAVLPRHILEDDFNRGALREAYGLTADPSRVVTAGAFAAESATPGERVTLKRNPHYWKKDEAGAPLPYLDRLVIEVMKDANNAFTRLQQGSLDIYDRLRPPDFADLRSQPGITQVSDLGPGLQTDQLWFNLNGGELNGRPMVEPHQTRMVQRRAIPSSRVERHRPPDYRIDHSARPGHAACRFRLAGQSQVGRRGSSAYRPRPGKIARRFARSRFYNARPAGSPGVV